MAIVFFCVVKQAWIYVEGWRDSRRRERRCKEDIDTLRKKKKGRFSGRKAGLGFRRGKGKVVVRGRYTLVSR